MDSIRIVAYYILLFMGEKAGHTELLYLLSTSTNHHAAKHDYF